MYMRIYQPGSHFSKRRKALYFLLIHLTFSPKVGQITMSGYT